MLSDLGKKVRNTRNRLSSFFVWWKYSGYGFSFQQPYSLGRVINSSFTVEPLNSSKDQDGRESADLFDITVSFALLQTSNEELSLSDALATMTDDSKVENGHRIYVSGSKLSQSELLGVSNPSNPAPDYTILGDPSNDPYDPDGLFFINVLLKPSPDIDLSGGESTIGIEFTGRLSPEQFDRLGDKTRSDGNHIYLGTDRTYTSI